MPIRHTVLNVRLIVQYRVGEDGVEYSRIISGDAFSSRRVEWVELPQHILDALYNQNYSLIESLILKNEWDRDEWAREVRRMKADFERTEMAAIRRQYCV